MTPRPGNRVRSGQPARQNAAVVYTLIDTDPEPDAVRHLTFVPFRPDGTCLAIPAGDRITLPSGTVAPGEHWLHEATLRIPLETAGFRFQRVHPVAIDRDRLYVWIEGSDRYRGSRLHRSIDLTSGTAEQIAARSDEPRIILDAARSYRSQSEQSYYADNLRLLEPVYLRGTTPQAGSGKGGTAAEWREHRESLVDGMDRDGTFLDVGCANGFLMESVSEWAAERGIRIEPYGVDLGAGLIAEAKRRLPQWADRLHVGNAIDWTPPDGRRFTYVHGLFDFWPPSRKADGVAHLRTLLEPGGRLLMSEYGSGDAGERLADLGYEVLGSAGETAWIGTI